MNKRILSCVGLCFAVQFLLLAPVFGESGGIASGLISKVGANGVIILDSGTYYPIPAGVQNMPTLTKGQAITLRYVPCYQDPSKRYYTEVALGLNSLSATPETEPLRGGLIGSEVPQPVMEPK